MDNELIGYVEIWGDLVGPPLIPRIAPQINVATFHFHLAFDGADPAGSAAFLKNRSAACGFGKGVPIRYPDVFVLACKIGVVNDLLIDGIFPCRPGFH